MNFTPEFIASQLEIAEKATPRPYSVGWDDRMLYGDNNAEYMIASANHYPDALREIARLQSQLDDWRQANEITLADRGPKDERHCSCVTFLRREIARLREALGDALNWERDVEEVTIPPEDVRVIDVVVEGTYRLHHLPSGIVISCDTKENGMAVLKKRAKEWKLKERARLVRENASLFNIIREALGGEG